MNDPFSDAFVDTFAYTVQNNLAGGTLSDSANLIITIVDDKPIAYEDSALAPAPEPTGSPCRRTATQAPGPVARPRRAPGPPRRRRADRSPD